MKMLASVNTVKIGYILVYEMAEGTSAKLLHQLIPAHEEPHAKVTVVGVGQVGMACAFAILVQDVCSEICLVDVIPDKLRGEMLDLQHGLPFVRNCTIKADTGNFMSK